MEIDAIVDELLQMNWIAHPSTNILNIVMPLTATPKYNWINLCLHHREQKLQKLFDFNWLPTIITGKYSTSLNEDFG